MPARRELTEKQLDFAKNYALGMTAVAAATKAGYAKAEHHASRLVVHGGVTKAVEQFKADLVASGQRPATLTPELIMRRTAEIATQNENLSAATAALRLGADIQGMLQGGQRELPEAARVLMEAIGAGAARELSNRNARTRAIEGSPPRELPTPADG